jgi:type II secretory ATPase GspE/PulE/Tfp pilus assembly ATPase PilB-like protein
MDSTTLLPDGLAFKLLRWTIFYVVLLIFWAITSTRTTIDARLTFGKSALWRWASIAVGLLVFVVVPSTEPRWLALSSLLLPIVPVVYAVQRFYRRGGTGLARATVSGSYKFATVLVGLTWRLTTVIIEAAWAILLALFRLDWKAAAKRLDGLKSQIRKILERLGLTPPSEALVFLDPGGLPCDIFADSRLKAFPRTAIESMLSILSQGLGLGASQIVFRPQGKDGTSIRYLIDGEWHDATPLPREEASQVTGVLKTIGDVASSQAGGIKKGGFVVLLGAKRCDITANVGPADGGELLSLTSSAGTRVLVGQGMASLGMDDGLLKAVHGLLQQPQGLVLFAGRPHSGRGTSLYAAVTDVNPAVRKIATVETAPLLDLEQVTQVLITNTATGFQQAISTALWHQPDVLIIRDIHDRETAEQALKASFAGKLVLAGFPAQDSTDALVKFLGLGVDRSIVKSALVAILSQRLARVLCSDCRTAYTPTPDLLAKLGIRPSGAHEFYRETGCPKCRATGYRGQTGIFELLVSDAALREALTGGASVEDLQKIGRSKLVRSLRQSAIGKVVNGITSVNEAAKVLK